MHTREDTSDATPCGHNLCVCWKFAQVTGWAFNLSKLSSSKHVNKPKHSTNDKHLGFANCPMKTPSRLTTTAILTTLVSMTASATAGDYSPTAAARPSPGYLNDYMRTQDPYNAAWDIGAQVRLRYEVKDNYGIVGNGAASMDFRKDGADVDNAYLLYRIKPRIGYTAEWWNAMVEARHSDQSGDERRPTQTSKHGSPEEDQLDLHQAYVTVGNHKEFPLSLKVGRQELSYGDERLIGSFAWNNLQRTFEGAKARWQNSWFAADFFGTRLVVPRDNVLNTVNDYDYFSGAYATTKKIPHQTSEFYFLARNAGADSPKAFASQGTVLVPLAGPRDIYTIGARGKSTPGDLGKWDYYYEGAYQFGHFNDSATSKSLEHSAYAGMAGAGYTFSDSFGTPRLGIEYNYGSGDSNPNDNKHETFENLFPTNHKFYGFMDMASWQNLSNLRFLSSIKPLPRLTLLAEGHLFWLADTHDNFYNVAGARRGGVASTGGKGYGINSGYSDSLGSEIDLIATYVISPQATVEAGFGHFFAGEYIKQSLENIGGSDDANFFYLQLTVNF